jgi:hypothetical protein
LSGFGDAIDTNGCCHNVAIDGQSLKIDLVCSGHDWNYVNHSDDLELAAADKSTRNDGIGPWLDPRHVPPWHWRKLSESERDQLRDFDLHWRQPMKP